MEREGNRPESRSRFLWLGMVVVFVALTGLYEVILHRELPDGLALRTWYEQLGLLGLMAWQVFLLVGTVVTCRRVFGVLESRPAKYIGTLALGSLCVIAIGLLALRWVAGAFRIDEEQNNDNGTITLIESHFLDETAYSLWEPEGILYRRFIREAADESDIDPDGTIEAYRKEMTYPSYEKTEDHSDTSRTEISETGADDEANDQERYAQINDGLVAVYEAIGKENDGYAFQTSWSAKGEEQTVIYEDDTTVRFIRYDRPSRNETCLLYVYYEAAKAPDGSYAPAEAAILEMYAYEPQTGRVEAAGRTAWEDPGTEAYRAMTGE